MWNFITDSKQVKKLKIKLDFKLRIMPTPVVKLVEKVIQDFAVEGQL